MRSPAGILSGLGLAAQASAGPCDIYAAGNTPCVAAHSTTRALYNSFNGALYQVIRGSDNATQDISPISTGGVASSGTQDNFCKGATCLITIIYDQSGHGNHLTRGPKGYWSGGSDNGNDWLASATGAPVTLNGHKVYGVVTTPGGGYRNEATNGVATGNDPEGIYGVFAVDRYNGGCCYDYGASRTVFDYLEP